MPRTPKNPTAKWVYHNGQMADLTAEHIFEIVQNLYAKGLAEAWFIGMGWPEGYHYCSNSGYLQTTFIPSVMGDSFDRDRRKRAIWFACRFLD